MKSIPLRLKDRQLEVLDLLQQSYHGLTNKEIAEKMKDSQGNVYNRLKSLIRKGLVYKSEHGTGRGTIYRVTSKGALVVLNHLTNSMLGFERPVGVRIYDSKCFTRERGT